LADIGYFLPKDINREFQFALATKYQFVPLGTNLQFFPVETNLCYYSERMDDVTGSSVVRKTDARTHAFDLVGNAKV
jgi:hypothetical protein